MTTGFFKPRKPELKGQDPNSVVQLAFRAAMFASSQLSITEVK